MKISKNLTTRGIQNIFNEKSHIGMIIQSTTLDTEDKVKQVYGGVRWVKIEGRMLIGSGGSYTINSTGGSSTITLSIANLPAHTHTVGAHSHDLNNHTHSIPALSGTAADSGNHTHGGNNGAFWQQSTGYGYIPVGSVDTANRIDIGAIREAGTHSHSVTTNASTTGASSGSTANSVAFNSGSTGSGTAFSIIPPYKAVYIWERTA